MPVPTLLIAPALNYRQRFPNDFQHSFGVSQDLIVPKSDHPESPLRQESATLDIRRLSLHGLAAVEFDDQPPFEADEVHDLGRERILATKCMSYKAVVAEVLPEATFSVGLVPAQLLGDFGGHYKELRCNDFFISPSPYPLPIRGEGNSIPTPVSPQGGREPKSKGRWNSPAVSSEERMAVPFGNRFEVMDF